MSFSYNFLMVRLAALFLANQVSSEQYLDIFMVAEKRKYDTEKLERDARVLANNIKHAVVQVTSV